MRWKTKRFLLPLLHIDDHTVDRRLIEQAIRATRTPFDCHGAGSLQAAVDYLRRSSTERHRPPRHPRRRAEFPAPAVILLDYDFGAHCGTDFLYWLRTLQRNTAIPVVMYSGSAGCGHVQECYRNGATHFLNKAHSCIRARAVVRTLHICFSYPIARFQLLSSLAESEPDLRNYQEFALEEWPCRQRS